MPFRITSFCGNILNLQRLLQMLINPLHNFIYHKSVYIFLSYFIYIHIPPHNEAVWNNRKTAILLKPSGD